MVLGSDRVVMSDMSELGPIDPQAFLSGRWQSVQNYLDAYDVHAATLKSDPGDLAAQIMLHKLDPAELQLCEAAVGRARQVAENLLKRGMFRNIDGNWTKTVTELLDTKRWLSHGQMISWEDAKDPLIGLVVEHHAYDSEEWQDYWRLYCLQRLAIKDREKIYESDYTSLSNRSGSSEIKLTGSRSSSAMISPDFFLYLRETDITCRDSSRPGSDHRGARQDSRHVR